MGVNDDDQENHCRLDGAKDFSSPAALRQLFSYLLVFGNVQQPIELLARYIDVMSAFFGYLLAADRHYGHACMKMPQVSGRVLHDLQAHLSDSRKPTQS